MTGAIPPEARLHPVRPLVAASVAVIREGRVLLAARAREPLRGLYTLPGGLVEAGERLDEAALRELDEEVGVTARIVCVLPPIEVIAREPDGRVRHHFVIHPHAAHWVAGEGRRGDEALDVRWVTRSDAAALPTTEGLHGVLVQAFAAVLREDGAAEVEAEARARTA